MAISIKLAGAFLHLFQVRYPLHQNQELTFFLSGIPGGYLWKSSDFVFAKIRQLEIQLLPCDHVAQACEVLQPRGGQLAVSHFGLSSSHRWVEGARHAKHRQKCPNEVPEASQDNTYRNSSRKTLFKLMYIVL